jgi:hypothetical protein
MSNVDKPSRAEVPDAGGKIPDATERFNREWTKIEIPRLINGGAVDQVTAIEFIQGKVFQESRVQQNDGSNSIILSHDDKSFAVFKPDKDGKRGECLYVKDRSGAIISPINGGLSIRQPNGDEQIHRGGTIDSNGTVTYPGADGLQHQRFLDGSAAQVSPDGNTRIVKQDGATQTRKQINANEMLTTETIDGKRREVRQFSNPQDLSARSLNAIPSSPDVQVKGVAKITSDYNDQSIIESQKIDFSREAPPITLRTSNGTLSFKPLSMTVNYQNWGNVEYNLDPYSPLEFKDKDGNVVPLRGESIRVVREGQGELYQINPGSRNTTYMRNDIVKDPPDPPIYVRSAADNSPARESREATQERLDQIKTQVETLTARYSATTKREQNDETRAEQAKIERDMLGLGREALPAIKSLEGQKTNPETAGFLDQVSKKIAKSPLPPAALDEMQERSFALFVEQNRSGGKPLTPADKQRLESLIERLEQPLPSGVDQRDLERELSLAEREQGNGLKTARQILLESELNNSVRAKVLYAERLTDSADAQDQQKAVEMLTSLVRTKFELLADPKFKTIVNAKAINDAGFLKAVTEESRVRGADPILINDLLNNIRAIRRIRIKGGGAVDLK